MAKFKVLIICGHGAGDSGAVGNGYKEYKLTRELGKLVASRLEAYADVDIYNTDRNAYKDVKNGNFNIGKYDYVFEIHFNSFNISAHGTECFVVPNEKGITVEQAIMKEMGKFFTLRDNDNIFDGVKRTRFAVINAVHKKGMSGALLETCFISSKADMNTYQKHKGDIADGIVRGIVKGFGLSKDGTSKPPASKPPVTKPPTQGTVFKKGDKVILSKNATTYKGASDGVKIPTSVKGKKYTVQQVSSNGKELLLKEIYSWVLASQCSKSTASKPAKPASKEIKVGDYVTPTNRYDYNGTRCIAEVLKGKYKVIEIKGNRVVLGSGLNTAFKKSDLKKA